MSELKQVGTPEARRVVAERTSPALQNRKLEQERPADTKNFFKKEATRVEHTAAEEKKQQNILKDAINLDMPHQQAMPREVMKLGNLFLPYNLIR